MADEYIRKQDAFDAVEARVAELMTHPEFRRKHLDIDFSGVVRNISAIKPADVTPVKHGEWISVPEMWGVFDIRYYCSECGKDAIINNSERYVLSDYCPHCGAIMDNKRGNENG